MSALGRVQASLVAANQETTVALANLNFDFSLVKVEAPAEYRPLGLALAKKRRFTAENGLVHNTARRLGSLFQSILPDTPNLIKVYGQRASEIAQSPEVNPTGSQEDGPFQDYIGVDGTTIWAAATSGPSAIAAHLLACILATHWPADEAVPIWVELVNERKKRLEENTSKSSEFRLDDAVASQMSLDEDQLATWDSSARAWLKAAEDALVVKTRQSNLRSILKDTEATVHSGQDLYTSVTEAWRLALSTFERIICGASYSITEGAVILALLSWHLYPDVITVAKEPGQLHQKDDLISGGQVILGLSSKDKSSSGVHWCLSLAHLSYYGPSQTITRSVAFGGTPGNRLTLADFTVVLIGGYIGLWNSEEQIDTCKALEIINLAISMVKEGLDAKDDGSLNEKANTWLPYFADAVSRYYGLVTGDPTTKLVDLGVRYKNFFKPNQQLRRYKDFFKPMQQSSTTMNSLYSKIVEANPPFRLFGMNNIYFGIAFTQKSDRLLYARSTAMKLLRAAERDTSPCFLLVFDHNDDEERKAYFYSAGIDENFKTTPIEAEVKLQSFILVRPGLEFNDPRVPRPSLSLFWARPPATVKKTLRYHSAGFIDRKANYEAGNGWLFDCGVQSADEEFLLFRGRNKRELPYGSPGVQRHFIPESGDSDCWTPIRIPEHSIQDVTQYLCSGKLCPIRFSSLFCTTSFYEAYLALLSPLFRTYQGLSGATISPEVLKCSHLMWDLLLGGREIDPTWILERSRELQAATLIFPTLAVKTTEQKQSKSSKLPSARLLGRNGQLVQSFKLIASLEIGQDLRLGSELLMDHIFAISIEDSLYIASPLMSDPVPGFGGDIEIRRVRGNIGRPGLNLLGFFSPSAAIRMREKEPLKWSLINHHEFDGKLEDFFSSTSLHLTLTGYIHNIALRGGSRFPSACFAEVVVSSHDAGNWVADLDLFNQSLIQELILITRLGNCCGSVEAGKPPDKQLRTIENWEELLDPPPVPAVFRAHGNWQARLAATFICLKNGYLTLIFGNHGCWNCAFAHLSQAEPGVILRPTHPKSPSSGSPRQERLQSSHSMISCSELEQETDVLDNDQDIPDPEPLKEDSSSDVTELSFTDQDGISIKPLENMKEMGDSTGIDTVRALNTDKVHVEAGLEAESRYILSEESSDESHGVSRPQSSGSEDEGYKRTQEGVRKKRDWPQDCGPRPIVFIL